MNRSFSTYKGVFGVALVTFFALPLVSIAAITYTRSPEGVAVSSPVTVTLTADSFRDFGLSPGVDRFYLTLDDDFNPVTECYPITQFPVTASFVLPVGDVVKGVMVVGFTGYCETGDEPHYLEGNGETGTVAFTVIGASVGTSTGGVAASPATGSGKVTVTATKALPIIPKTASVPKVSTTAIVPVAGVAKQTMPPTANSPFGRDLFLGTTGDDVRTLQVWLNTHGYVIAASGPGSPGNESNYFGKLTQAALVKFQLASGITPPAGYFGPKTRAAVATQ